MKVSSLGSLHHRGTDNEYCNCNGNDSSRDSNDTLGVRVPSWINWNQNDFTGNEISWVEYKYSPRVECKPRGSDEIVEQSRFSEVYLHPQ